MHNPTLYEHALLSQYLVTGKMGRLTINHHDNFMQKPQSKVFNSHPACATKR